MDLDLKSISSTSHKFIFGNPLPGLACSNSGKLDGQIKYEKHVVVAAVAAAVVV